MKEQPDLTGNFEIALDAAEKGIVCVPCHPGTKVPAVKWKLYQTERPTEQQYREWFLGTRNNIAILCTGMVIFDMDDPSKVDLVLQECGDTPHKLRTPSGGLHLGYRRRMGVVLRNQVKIRGMDIDIRTNGGLEVIANSRTPEGAYKWLDTGLRAISELPVANVGWTREKRRRRRPRAGAILAPQDVPPGQGRIRHPEAYCLHVESIQGQNGSKGLVRVVCVLRDAGRAPRQILDFILNVWNPQCARPPWSEAEVLHAVERHCGST
jgi:hypothetical protein